MNVRLNISNISRYLTFDDILCARTLIILKCNLTFDDNLCWRTPHVHKSIKKIFRHDSVKHLNE